MCSEHVFAAPGPKSAQKELTTKAFQDAIKIEGLLTHARKWQELANRANGTRSFGTLVSTWADILQGYKLYLFHCA